jgi:hypothetical protein
MQSYDDLGLIPRKITNSSQTCVDKRPIFGQIAEKNPKVVQRDTKNTKGTALSVIGGLPRPLHRKCVNRL